MVENITVIKHELTELPFDTELRFDKIFSTQKIPVCVYLFYTK